MSSCPLCNQSFDSPLSNEFVVHVNGCLDLDEQQRMPKNFHAKNEAKLPELIKKQKERQQAADCVVCGKAKATAAHIKKCGKQYGVATNQLVELIGQDQHAANANLQKIVLKNANLDTDQVMKNLFIDDASQTENELTNQTPVNRSPDGRPEAVADYSKYFVRPPLIGGQPSTSTQENDFTVVLHKPNELSRNGTQTKLKVVRKTKTKSSATQQSELVENVPLHESKKKRTVKLRRNPLVKANLDDKIIQNFKDEYEVEKELPKSWKMANLSYDATEYLAPGFEAFEGFRRPFGFKESMNGFEIGLENKK